MITQLNERAHFQLFYVRQSLHIAVRREKALAGQHIGKSSSRIILSRLPVPGKLQVAFLYQEVHVIRMLNAVIKDKYVELLLYILSHHVFF